VRIEELVEALRQAGKKPKKSANNNWVSLCPAHEDSSPSLAVGVSPSSGKILFSCYAGCSAEDIVGALGLKMQDMFPEEKEAKKREWVANYDYVDIDGRLLFQVQRFVEPDGRKTFTQRMPDGIGGWIYTTSKIENKPLYRLPEIVQAVREDKEIWVVEGEKDADNLFAINMVATCNPGGAGKWQPHHAETLRGARVTICADRDLVGWKHAAAVRDSLQEVAKSVKVVEPPEPHKDISDALEGEGLPRIIEIDPEERIKGADPFRDFVNKLRDLIHENIPIEKKIARAQAGLESLSVNEELPGGRLVTWEEFLREPVAEYDWVIPGLLERGERVMLVASEGAGKTLLMRQIALLSAAGRHPFRFDRMAPISTLMFDFENPERIIRRTTNKIAERLRSYNSGFGKSHLVIKPDGVNLLKPEDRVFFEKYVEMIEPDLILMGPVYKMFIEPSGRTAEAVITEVVRFLDHIRDTYNCALWLEHHAPLGTSLTSREMRPFGSAVWMRWSEFGLGLVPDVTQPRVFELRHYRGMRDQREWPKVLRWGEVFPFETTEYYNT